MEVRRNYDGGIRIAARFVKQQFSSAQLFPLLLDPRAQLPFKPC